MFDSVLNTFLSFIYSLFDVDNIKVLKNKLLFRKNALVKIAISITHLKHMALDHDKMILCLVATHASVFNTLLRPFLINSTREAFFVSLASFYQKILLATFYFILLHLSKQILMLRISPSHGHSV